MPKLSRVKRARIQRAQQMNAMAWSNWNSGVLLSNLCSGDEYAKVVRSAMGNKKGWKKCGLKTLYKQRLRFVKGNETRMMRRKLKAGEGGSSGLPSGTGVEHTSDNMEQERQKEDQENDESDEEVCIQIKEEVSESIPVEFLASTNELPLQPPQYDIAVAPTSVDSHEPAYSISIREIQDPLSQNGTSTIQSNFNTIPPDNGSDSHNLLQIRRYHNIKDIERPKKIETTTELNKGTKRKKKGRDIEGEDDSKVTVKRNPPRQAKTMTYNQELMNKKLSDIMNSQKKILNALKEMPNVGEDGDEAKSSTKEDRFDICGKHIASLLRDLPTFDALALEAKLMDIVYKEREKLETFRISMQGFSAVNLPKTK